MEIAESIFTLIKIIFLEFFKAIFSLPVLLLIVIVAVYLIVVCFEHKKTTYYKITKNNFFATRFDMGKYGEYMIYKRLRSFENNGGKFLFNVYLPKENDETTEIDVLLILREGIFVFESKNYSGWIFGKESQHHWTQSLPQGRGRKSHKEHFLNPILQNKLHIESLKNLIGENSQIHSVIVFSERCTLKDVTVTSEDIKVIKRYDIKDTVNEICTKTGSGAMKESEIQQIYNQLFPLTQVSDELKEKHINDIKKKISARKDEEVVKNSCHKVNSEISESTEDLLCPKCGSALILRTAKRGANAGKQFYGCSNYPKCRYIKE